MKSAIIEQRCHNCGGNKNTVQPISREETDYLQCPVCDGEGTVTSEIDTESLSETEFQLLCEHNTVIEISGNE